MNELLLFTDGSVNPQSHGYGAYLAVPVLGLPLKSLRNGVKVRRFDQTSSAKLELHTLLWALSEIGGSGTRVTVYTDSQNIVALPSRRARLEQFNYYTRKDQLHNNHELYRNFFRITDRLDCQFVKVRGHQQAAGKDEIDQLFSLVDRAARKALRQDSR